MKITYLGQACTLIEAGGIRLLTDPWLTEGAYFGTWYHTNVLADAGVSPERVIRDVDCIFLSHEHEDHLDPDTLRLANPETPIYICRFPTPKFRHQLEALGLRNINELESGKPHALTSDVTITIFGTAEYTNDAAILVEAEGCRVFNETDCKLDYADLVRLGEKGIDIGFFMFSGANWYPMLYDYPDAQMTALLQHRRRALLRGFVQRAKLTRARLAVPAAGPCTVLDPDLAWMNAADRGIFIDPAEAVAFLDRAACGSRGLHMAATDVWTRERGFEPHAPASFRGSRMDYLDEAVARLGPAIRERRLGEPPARPDLGARLAAYFNEHIGAQSRATRERIGAVVAFDVSGPHGGQWTVDFNAAGPEFVRAGIAEGWTYRIAVEDKLLSPFLDGDHPYFEHLFLSLRVQLARRPDTYNEPLYHFFYEPDPAKLDGWYRDHRAPARRAAH